MSDTEIDPMKVSVIDDQPWHKWYEGRHKRARFNNRRQIKHPELADMRDNYIGMDGYTTIPDLLAKIQEIAPDVALGDVMVHAWQLRWASEATPEELAEEEARKVRAAEGAAKWEREQWAKLTDKYGPSGPPAV